MYCGLPKYNEKLFGKGTETTMNKKTKTAAPLSENTRRAIIITAIIAVAVIVLSVALALILRPTTTTPPANDPSSSGSSSLDIRNGDFYYTSSDDTAYPKTAQNWSRYGYKAVQGSSHDFESLSTNDKAVMGIVTTATTSEDGSDTWDTVAKDLEVEGVAPTNPGTHSEDLGDDKVYMISTKEATAASILSDSFSVSSSKSVKVTVWLNTEQLTSGKAVVMLQKSTVSAKAENWYAYNFEVAQKEGWQALDFYIFNRDSSTKYIRLSVGLGNVYSGEEGYPLVGEGDDAHPIQAEGTLFVDDITYEEVTANDYRAVVDAENAANNTQYKVIENEDIEDESKYLAWTLQGKTDFDKTYDNATTYANDAGYSPFTNRDDFFKDTETSDPDAEVKHDTPTGFTIYKLSHDGSNPSATEPTAIGVRLAVGNVLDSGSTGKHGGINTLYSLWQKDHHHVSFWVRVKQNNKVSKANIYVQSWETDDNEWKDLDSGSWTAQVSSQDIDTDSNCGWVKYDVYLKPAAVDREVSILVTLGSKDGVYTDEQTQSKLFPSGEMYITRPAYEKISSKDYNNASSGTYAKKLDLTGSSATTSVTNGTFSNVSNSAMQPSDWTPAFAGDNMLYSDGRGDETIEGINRKADDVKGSRIERGYALYPNIKDGGDNDNLDDAQKNVLRINNAKATSFGYFSNDITLSARTVYVFSVLTRADVDTAKAHFYLLNNDTSAERSKRVIAEGKALGGAVADKDSALGQAYAGSELGNDWQRLYIVVVTGAESQTARVALFNGKLDGSEKGTGSVYFDQVQMLSLGSYATADDPDWTEDQTDKKYIVNWTMNDYNLGDEKITVKDFLSKANVDLLVKVGALKLDEGEQSADGSFSSLTVLQPDEEAWNTMLTVPAEEESDDTTTETETETESTPVDWGLLFSVISSVALVAALLVVLVVKLFKNRKAQKKSA